jgi:hypothetical protein
MTETARKIMGHFVKHGKIEPGSVLTVSELLRTAVEWGKSHSENLDSAMEELRDEGFVIITSPHGLELTARGVSYLLGE